VLCDGLITASCGSGGGGNYLVTVRPGEKNGRSPEFVYKVLQRDAAPYVPTPIYKDGLLFLLGDGGFAACFDAASGDKHWFERLGGNFYSSPVCIEGRLFCVSTMGEVIVLNASDEFEELGRSPLGEDSHATPAVAGGRLYLRTYNHLISVGGKAEASGK
jgi:outer membrane protein assembly factor BamB